MRRKIRHEWFIDYPWLKMDHSTQCFYCALCRRYQQPGIFMTGKSLINPKKDNFAKHAETDGHKLAVYRDVGMSQEDAVEALKKEEPVLIEDGDDGISQEMDKRKGQLDEDIKPPKHLDDAIYPPEGTVVPVSAQEFLAFCAKRRGPQHRRIQLEWFLEYPWLEVDRKRAVFLCKYCRVYRPLGVFVAGKPIEDPKQDDLSKHEQTDGHKEAVKSYDKDSNVATRPDLKGSSVGVVDASMVLSYTSNLGSTTSPMRTALTMQFPWLQHDADSDVYLCLPCRECSWRPPGSPNTCSHVWSGPVKKDVLEHHEASRPHKLALTRFREMQKAAVDTALQ